MFMYIANRKKSVSKHIQPPREKSYTLKGKKEEEENIHRGKFVIDNNGDSSSNEGPDTREQK